MEDKCPVCKADTEDIEYVLRGWDITDRQCKECWWFKTIKEIRNEETV